jgi:hypothetical protein
VPAAHKHSTQHQSCIAPHARFHTAAAEVLKFALEGHAAEAEQRLHATDSAFNAASAALTRGMMAWQRAA